MLDQSKNSQLAQCHLVVEWMNETSFPVHGLVITKKSIYHIYLHLFTFEDKMKYFYSYKQGMKCLKNSNISTRLQNIFYLQRADKKILERLGHQWSERYWSLHWYLHSKYQGDKRTEELGDWPSFSKFGNVFMELY